MTTFTLWEDYTFQSTLSVRRATRISSTYTCCMYISIHALRKESDKNQQHIHLLYVYFNPRSP